MISKRVDTTNRKQLWLILQDNNHPELQKQHSPKPMVARKENPWITDDAITVKSPKWHLLCILTKIQKQ